MNKTDIQLKQDVEAELQWDRTVDAAEVGVSVESGAVSLRGEVDSYAAKWAAIDASPLCSVAIDLAPERDGRVLDAHAYLRGIDRRIPLQLGLDGVFAIAAVAAYRPDCCD